MQAPKWSAGWMSAGRFSRTRAVAAERGRCGGLTNIRHFEQHQWTRGSLVGVTVAASCLGIPRGPGSGEGTFSCQTRQVPGKSQLTRARERRGGFPTEMGGAGDRKDTCWDRGERVCGSLRRRAKSAGVEAACRCGGGDWMTGLHVKRSGSSHTLCR